MPSFALQRGPLEAELVACVGQQAADVVLGLIVPCASARLPAEAALSLPFFTEEALQPLYINEAVRAEQPTRADASGNVQQSTRLSGKEAADKPSNPGIADQVAVAAIASTHCSLQPSAEAGSMLQLRCSSPDHLQRDGLQSVQASTEDASSATQIPQNTQVRTCCRSQHKLQQPSNYS